MSGYAVVDLETSGFHPPLAEIVEVAVVHVDATGHITGAWDTLVRPDESVGATHVHGVTQGMVANAPKFGDIAAALHALLADRIVVAHNLMFDGKFLVSEFARIGFESPEIRDGACTLKIAQRHLPGPPHKLVNCCEHAGIVLTDAHKALGDATATAKLLGYYLERGIPVQGTPVDPLPTTSASTALADRLFRPRNG